MDDWSLRSRLLDAMQPVAAAVGWPAWRRVGFAALSDWSLRGFLPASAIEHREDHGEWPAQRDDYPACIFKADKLCGDRPERRTARENQRQPKRVSMERAGLTVHRGTTAREPHFSEPPLDGRSLPPGMRWRRDAVYAAYILAPSNLTPMPEFFQCPDDRIDKHPVQRRFWRPR